MAVLIKRTYPLHLKHRYRHILRQLLRDGRFIGSTIGLILVGAIIGLLLVQAPRIIQLTDRLEQAVAFSLATSGDYAGWHTYTDAQDRFQASFPCFADTIPQTSQDTSSMGTLPTRNTACLYNVQYEKGGQTQTSQDSFWIKAAAVHYPADSTGQAALLQEIANSFDPHDTPTTTTLHGLPAVVQRSQSGSGSQLTYQYMLYTFGNGNLYRIITSYPTASTDYTSRFVSSFELMK